LKLLGSILTITLNLFASVYCQSLTCPDPKKIIHEPYCSQILGLDDTVVLTVQIYLPIKPDHDPQKQDTTYWNSLARWSYLLFTTYDLRDYYTPSKRLPPPADSAVSWVYNLVKATKKTVVEMREAPYLTSIGHDSPQGNGIGRQPLGRSRPAELGIFIYDLNGRTIQPNLTAPRNGILLFP
jgi:hypothetical protein